MSNSKVKKILNSQIFILLISIAVGFIVASIILKIAGYNPIEVYSALFKGVFSKPRYLINTAVKAAPIILTGVSFSFAMKVGLFNIGVEGQYVVGTICATIVGILCDFPSIIQYPLVIIAGTIGGAIYGMLGGLLKTYRGVHEVTSGIMLNWIAFYLSNFVVQIKGIHRPDTTTSNIINNSSMDPIAKWKLSEAGQTALQNNATLNELIGRTDFNLGILYAVVVAILIAYYLENTSSGFQLRAVGANPNAARAAGINVERNTIKTFLIAGAIAGLSGALQISGVTHRLYELMAQENYGFNGLSVAVMAGGNPIGTIFTGLLYSGLNYGAGQLQLSLGVPAEIIDILIGVIVFCVSLQTLIPKLINWYEQRKGLK